MLFFQVRLGLRSSIATTMVTSFILIVLLQAVSSIAGANPAGGLPGRLGETEPHSLTEKSASYGEVDSVVWNPPYKNLRFHRKRSSGECSICLEDLATNQGKPWPNGGHLFHESCITSWQRTRGGASCPICRATPPARPPASEDTSRRNGPQDASRSRNRNGSTGMASSVYYMR
ncbi:hypothetical protein Pst134EB_004289 [Puccinia striiformis f. sp. tritici]|nr:hypothetical protein Pst134EB_004289 [Puccinia striiformis f. sp. tritici]